MSPLHLVANFSCSVRAAKAAAGSKDAPTGDDRDTKDWAALNLTASEARPRRVIFLEIGSL
jgi:hypothetical protein